MCDAKVSTNKCIFVGKKETIRSEDVELGNIWACFLMNMHERISRLVLLSSVQINIMEDGARFW